MKTTMFNPFAGDYFNLMCHLPYVRVEHYKANYDNQKVGVTLFLVSSNKHVSQ